MKRFLFLLIAVAMLAAQSLAFPTTAEAASIRKLDANSLLGMSSDTLTNTYGSPARTEPSEYGFTWYVYSQDLKNYFMAGVQDGTVVAVYTNAKVMNYKGEFKLNSKKSAVRSKLGKPIQYVRSGNLICVLSSRAQRDFFAVGSNYVIVFYDNIKGGKVTSVLIVPQSAQDRALLERPAMSDELVAAYARISVDLINAVRVRSGLKKLAVNQQNTTLAFSRSQDMRDRNYFSHYTPEKLSPFDQAKRMGIKYSSMGENIAFGDLNAIFAHEAFMNSKGHRNNVLKSKYTKVGAGVAYGSKRYVLLTNIFTK